MPKSSSSKRYLLRSAAKNYPHESQSVVFLGVSRKRSVIKEARNRIGQRKVILLALSKKKVDLSPKSLRLVSKRVLKATKDSSNEAGDKTVETKQPAVENIKSKPTDVPEIEEVQCLYFNCCNESDATPRSDLNSSDRCDWTTQSPPINPIIDEDVTNVSGPADAILPPVPAPNTESVHSYPGQPTVFGQLMVKRVRSECGELHPAGASFYEDDFLNDFLRDIRLSRI